MGDTSSSSEEESYSPFFFKCYDCGTLITGSNRAYELSYQMGWRNQPGCSAPCKCGFPVRAKELRDNVFGRKIDSDKSSDINALIYCQNWGTGYHVYYGTYNTCIQGNGYTAEQMESNEGLRHFNRYSRP